MARKPRIHYPGALYHVIIRGNDRQDIFFDAEDRCRFYLLLQEGVERFGHRIHAFCLMPSHVHLAIQVGEIPLSRIMQNLALRYTRWVNWRQNRCGHLFQGRFKAILVEADTYLLELIRYIHLNPVRAGVTSKPEDYPWGGHRAYLGQESLPWLTVDWVLGQFATKPSTARVGYRAFVEEGINEGHRPEFHGGKGLDARVLGKDDFVDKVLGQAERRPIRSVGVAEIVAAVGREYGLQIEALAAIGKERRPSEARAAAAYLILESGHTLVALSRLVNRDVSSLSSAVKRLRGRVKTDRELAGRIMSLASGLQILILQS